MLLSTPSDSPDKIREVINENYRSDEKNLVSYLIEQATLTDMDSMAVKTRATHLVERVRKERKNSTGIDSFLMEYALSSEEGIALMCLAEALLRVPDNATIDNLIKDKLTNADWASHRGQSESFFVNATTWALMLTGKVLNPEKAETTFSKALFKVMNRGGEGLVRTAVDKAMRIMSKQFVMGRTIQEAMKRASKAEAVGYLYSYDMLGEAALTSQDAERYFKAYQDAIESVGQQLKTKTQVVKHPGISIKLSALHPRYQEAQKERVMAELPLKLLTLARIAKRYDISLIVDAEESERLELSMDIIEQVFSHPDLRGWQGFGLAVQSYQKRAFYLLDWVADLARKYHSRIMVRLIKGAYWDSEIKKAQMSGLSEYPVFTRKVFTDVSFQACAKKMLTMTDAIYPMFATHNAYSVAMVLEIVKDYRDFEFQCLHGMGKELYEQIVPAQKLGIPCRIYAPVGSHEDLLPYLVRRLLENGANSSFVNRIVDEKAPISELAADPVKKARKLLDRINTNIPLPKDIFQPQRCNSKGLDFSDRHEVATLQKQLEQHSPGKWKASPSVDGEVSPSDSRAVYSPQNQQLLVGYVHDATEKEVDKAIGAAQKAWPKWADTAVDKRATLLERYAELLEENTPKLLAMACFEAGKTMNDGIAEIREAVDFCYYYSQQARALMSKPQKLQGYTGEENHLSLHPRGIIACISPWNFPLAIFTGQIVAALATGNCVIAKPAEQTSLIASFAVDLMHKAGIPKGVVQLLPGNGETVGASLVNDKRIKGVVFTGSTETANLIQRSLASRGGEIIPLIAETGGQNAMIVDSSALLEQVALDVLNSSFGSAGQRCSALRVLYVQEEVYPRMIHLIKGAMAEIKMGDPQWLETDVGPVIDKPALENLQKHVDSMRKNHEIIYQCVLSESCEDGFFMQPTAIAIDKIQSLSREVFGPILHIISYKEDGLDKVIQDINSTGYGLTLGIHSRISEKIEYIRQRVHAGNCYVNRNMIGAVVGLQPFGGEGLSGTGPKAGGPFYLPRFCVERTYTVDTTAAGGNASLMSQADS